MKKEDTEMMLRIFETERAGYAYLYPSDGGERKEDYISTTAENIANYIGSHMFEAEKIVITDMCDRLILDTCGYFINSCPNQEFCKEIHPFLIPIQMGEKDAGEVLSVSRGRYSAIWCWLIRRNYMNPPTELIWRRRSVR